MTEQRTLWFLSHQLSFDYVGLASMISGSAALERSESSGRSMIDYLGECKGTLMCSVGKMIFTEILFTRVTF